MQTPRFVLLVTAISLALITGLWYAYSCSVNPGLGKLPDKEYLSAMRSINREILNLLFFSTFIGTLILLPLSSWLNFRQPGFPLLLAASIIYAVGVFGVTIAGNLPLNDALEAFDIQAASASEILNQRLNFEPAWNKFHQIRAIASFICLVW